MTRGAHIMRFDKDGHCVKIVNIKTREQWYRSWAVCRINAKRGRSGFIFGASFNDQGKLHSVTAWPVNSYGVN